MLSQIRDCNFNCVPANWVGDGQCEDGEGYIWDGEMIDLNCAEFDFDGGDCLYSPQP